MELVKLNVGDTAWVYAPGHKGERSPRKVVHVFEMYGLRQHVVETNTAVDPILSVYSELMVSDAPDKPIGFWRKFGRKATPPVQA